LQGLLKKIEIERLLPNLALQLGNLPARSRQFIRRRHRLHRRFQCRAVRTSSHRQRLGLRRTAPAAQRYRTA
jgi:hypothetical protein